jgi:hypothetical protein
MPAKPVGGPSDWVDRKNPGAAGIVGSTFTMVALRERRRGQHGRIDAKETHS